MTHVGTDSELFGQFLARIQTEAACEFSLDVLRHALPNTIQWGKLSDPHLYPFDAQPAREQGIEQLVADAMARVRSDMP